MAPKNDFTFEITRNIGVISESKKGWSKELNLVSWNGRAPVYDIREWTDDHTRMGKGITLSANDAEALFQILKEELNKQ